MNLYTTTLMLALSAPLAFSSASQAGCEPPDGADGAPSGTSSGELTALGATAGETPSSSEATLAGDGSLNEAQVAWLVQMREEEKLARDVYLTLGERWDVNVFRNIPKAEQRHMDAVGALLERYGVEDPIQPGTEDVVGVFTSDELRGLYGELVAQGQGSLGDALRVGAAIEELDIDDLDDALAELPGGLPADIAQVYANLKRGSRNHLRAFVGQLRALGEHYEPSYLSVEAVDEILSQPIERGAGAGQGRAGHVEGSRRGRGWRQR